MSIDHYARENMAGQINRAIPIFNLCVLQPGPAVTQMQNLVGRPANGDD
jgi:hypothetical protein